MEKAKRLLVNNRTNTAKKNHLGFLSNPHSYPFFLTDKIFLVLPSKKFIYGYL